MINFSAINAHWGGLRCFITHVHGLQQTGFAIEGGFSKQLMTTMNQYLELLELADYVTKLL